MINVGGSDQFILNVCILYLIDFYIKYLFTPEYLLCTCSDQSHSPVCWSWSSGSPARPARPSRLPSSPPGRARTAAPRTAQLAPACRQKTESKVPRAAHLCPPGVCLSARCLSRAATARGGMFWGDRPAPQKPRDVTGVT